MNKPFEILASEGYKTLKLLGTLDSSVLKTLVSEEKNLVNEHLVVNCENMAEMNNEAVRFFIGLKNQLKEKNFQIRFVLVNEKTKAFFKDQGVDGALKTCATLRAALVDFGLVTPLSLDVNFINPFLTATMHVLKVQASTEAKAGQIYKKDSNEKYSGDISGVIGLVSEAFNGAVVITFPEKTFLTIIGRMLGEEYTEINKEIADGAGELTNIIFGSAKTVLNQKGYGIKTAIPSVITGKDHSVTNLTKGPRVVVPFESDAGNFFIEISLTT